MFLTECLRQHPNNRDLLEKLKGKNLPSDLRHVIWRSVLNNSEEEREYSNLLRTNKSLTVSQFEMNILNETRGFVNKFVSTEVFDAAMIQCMKTILSYYERKQDRIISDYHYMICMPLIIAFCELRWLLNSPAELIGIYFNVMKIVHFFDPMVHRRMEQDEQYELTLINKAMTLLSQVDKFLFQKIKGFMEENERNRRTFALIIRKFLQTLSFAFLNVDSALYVWDQIMLKVEPQESEMYFAFVAMLLCCKDELMMIDTWSDFAEMIYLKAKTISLNSYTSKYYDFIEKIDYYVSRYNYDSVPVEDIMLDKINLVESLF